MSQSKKVLALELKQHIISYLNLDFKPEDIKNDTVLFESELELDSIDSLELIVLLEREQKPCAKPSGMYREIFFVSDKIIEKTFP